MEGLMCALQEKLQSTYIQMLSSEEKARIEESLRRKSLAVEHVWQRIDVDRIYRTYFMPQKFRPDIPA